MHRTIRRLATVSAAALACVLVAGPAMAHPAFNPNTVPAGETHTLNLVVPHGCTASGGAPAEGEETSPTVALSVQRPEGVMTLAPHEVDGWTLRTGQNAFTWSDAGGSTTDPITFVVDVEVAPGAPGQIDFFVAQDCEQGSILWNDVTPEEGGNPPAILLVGDAVGTTEVDHGDHETTEGGTADGEHDAADGDMAEGEHDAADGDMAEGEHSGDMEAAAAETGSGQLPGGLVVLVLVLFAGGFAAILKMT